MVSRTKAASRIDHSRVATPSARQAPAISSKRPVGIARPPGRPAAEIIAFVSLTWISLLIPDTMKITAMNRRPKKTATMALGYPPLAGLRRARRTAARRGGRVQADRSPGRAEGG